MRAAFSANRLARLCFREERARALLAGCAAHSILPLTQPLTAAMGVLFAVTAHVVDWPVAQGGSRAIGRALASYLMSLGGRIETGRRVERLRDLPQLTRRALRHLAGPARDASPATRCRPATGGASGATATGPAPSSSTGRSTGRFRGAIPPAARPRPSTWAARSRRSAPRSATCTAVATIERPFLILCQQSEVDATRAPAGKHTGYAYCHVPGGSTVDMTDAIERQVERFAPGFRDRILARHATSPADFERYNPNYRGGAITGGVADAFQLWNRPVTRCDPYATPNPRLFICSAATPPGGGVHGQCGYFAARSALRRLGTRS